MSTAHSQTIHTQFFNDLLRRRVIEMVEPDSKVGILVLR